MEVLLITIFTFLAFYGALHIVMEFASSAANRYCGGVAHMYTVITVKDREDDVEGIIRAAARRQLRMAYGGSVPEIYAVDLESSDNTLEILQKLELEYEFLHAFRKDEYVEWIGDDGTSGGNN